MIGNITDASMPLPVAVPVSPEGVGLELAVLAGVGDWTGVAVGVAAEEELGDGGGALAADALVVGAGDGLDAASTVNEYLSRWSSPSSAENEV